MRSETILLPIAFGWLTGMRSLAGPTYASYRLRGKLLQGRGPVSRVLGSRSAPLVLSALALGEAGLDKWPKAPDRTAPSSLGVRALLGAVAGAAVAESVRVPGERNAAWVSAALGAAAAVVSSYAMLWLRQRAATASGVSAQRLGFAEDALTLGLGTALART